MNDFELRRRLATLPRGIEPAHDLWPGIADRLAIKRARRHRRAPVWLGLGLAASAALVAVLAPITREPARTDRPVAGALVLRQAETLAAEYGGALRALGPVSVPSELSSAIEGLDASVVELHAALREEPEADFLLEQLRRTYAQRLRLSRRLVTG